MWPLELLFENVESYTVNSKSIYVVEQWAILNIFDQHTAQCNGVQYLLIHMYTAVVHAVLYIKQTHKYYNILSVIFLFIERYWVIHVLEVVEKEKKSVKD